LVKAFSFKEKCINAPFMPSKQKALLAIILASFFGGGVAVFVKLAILEIPVFSLNFFRFLIAIMFMFLIVMSSLKNTKKHWLKLLLVCLLGTANTVIFSFGVGKTSATVSQILYAAVPLIVSVISYALLKERLHRKQIIGILTGFLGVAIIILVPVLNNSQKNAENFLGNMIILIAVLSFSFYSVFSKRLHMHYSALQLTGFFIFTSLMTQFVLAPIDVIVYPNWWQHVTWLGILSTLYLGTFGLVVWYVLYQYAIKHGTPTIASLTFYLQPISTFIWAFFLLQERLNLTFIIGAIITFAGLWITTTGEKQKISVA
jgi:drug/metabolite transporter (DMT)-like permease